MGPRPVPSVPLDGYAASRSGRRFRVVATTVTPIPKSTIEMIPSRPASDPVNGVGGFGGVAPAIGVTMASSSELTDRPRMSSPVAVPTLVTGTSPTTKSFVSVADSPGSRTAMSPTCPRMSSSTLMSYSVVSPVFVTT